MYRLSLDCGWPGKMRNPLEDAKRAVTLAARVRRRRLPAWPEVIPGAPDPRPRKRGTGAPGMQPALTEQTPMPVARLSAGFSGFRDQRFSLCLPVGFLCPLCSAFLARNSRKNQLQPKVT
jgi:hypothetical protein